MDNDLMPLKRVYLIDDNPAEIRLISRWVHRSMPTDGSCEFKGFETPKELGEAIKAQMPDLVMFDQNLTIMQGIDLVKKLNERYPNTMMAKIIISGVGSTTLASQATELGSDAYLSKASINMPMLWERLEVIYHEAQRRHSQRLVDRHNKLVVDLVNKWPNPVLSICLDTLSVMHANNKAYEMTVDELLDIVGIAALTEAKEWLLEKGIEQQTILPIKHSTYEAAIIQVVHNAAEQESNLVIVLV